VRDLVPVVPDSTAPRRLSNHTGVLAEPSLRKRLPDEAGVGTAGSDLVRLDDSVPGVEERGSARLQLEAVKDKLHRQRVAVLGDERGGLASRIERLLRGLEVVVVGLGSVRRREERGGEAVLLHEALRHDEQELGPDLADGVDTPVSGLLSAGDSAN